MKTRNAALWSSRHIIPSDTSVGSALIDGLLEAMLERDWPASEQFHVQLAYQEALVNAVDHGNRRSPQKTVEIEMACDRRRIEIRITDQGDGFDPSDVPDPRQEALLEVPGGRGLLLIHEVMSEIKYNATGNQVTMTKRRGSAKQGQSA